MPSNSITIREYKRLQVCPHDRVGEWTYLITSLGSILPEEEVVHLEFVCLHLLLTELQQMIELSLSSYGVSPKRSRHLQEVAADPHHLQNYPSLRITPSNRGTCRSYFVVTPFEVKAGAELVCL